VTPRIERTAMRLAVDPAGETADDHHTGRCELASEHARHLGAVGRAGARADDRDRGARKQIRVTLTSQVEASRRIVNRTKQGRQVTLA
jgi:hypothetical protein